MPQFDLPIEALREYRPELPRPADLEKFWAETLRYRARPRHPELLRAISTPVFTAVATYDVDFSGFDGTPCQGLAPSTYQQKATGAAAS